MMESYVLLNCDILDATLDANVTVDIGSSRLQKTFTVTETSLDSGQRNGTVGQRLKSALKDINVIRPGRVDDDSIWKELTEMRLICLEYEKTIVQLQQKSSTELDQKDKELSLAIDERDSIHDQYAVAQNTLTDGQTKFIRLQSAIEDRRNNEDRLKDSIKQFESLIREEQQKYQVLKKLYYDRVQHANSEIERALSKKVNKKLKLQIRLLRMRNRSLQSLADQKETENKDLRKMCDDLKAGSFVHDVSCK